MDRFQSGDETETRYEIRDRNSAHRGARPTPAIRAKSRAGTSASTASQTRAPARARQKSLVEKERKGEGKKNRGLVSPVFVVVVGKAADRVSKEDAPLLAPLSALTKTDRRWTCPTSRGEPPPRLTVGARAAREKRRGERRNPPLSRERERERERRDDFFSKRISTTGFSAVSPARSCGCTRARTARATCSRPVTTETWTLPPRCSRATPQKPWSLSGSTRDGSRRTSSCASKSAASA